MHFGYWLTRFILPYLFRELSQYCHVFRFYLDIWKLFSYFVVTRCGKDLHILTHTNLNNMNLSRVYHETIVNFGCSYSLNNGELNPTNGYFVGGFVKSMVVHLSEFNERHLQNFILCNSPLLSQDNAYLGTWIDGETNLVHIDVSMLIDNLVNALDTASLYNEIAIYDNANGKSIYLRNHMQYIEFRQSLIHLQGTIFIPCLNANINKTAFISTDGYNSDLESQAIIYAYIKYITG